MVKSGCSRIYSLQFQEQSINKMGSGIQVTTGLLVLAVFTRGLLAEFDDNYYSIEVNHKTIQCKMCPPGSYWIQHCSQDGGQAKCKDCPDGRFTEHYSRGIYCERCSECKGNYKESREVVVKECTRFNDTKCECKPGYWREGQVGDCREVSPCEPGYGVKKIANSHNDTACEKCVNGKTISNTSSEVTPCQNCSVCPEGWVKKSSCNKYEDTVCVKKDEVEDNKVGLIVGVFCGVLTVLILVGIILFYSCPEKTAQVLQKLRTSCRKRQRHEKHDDVEQATPLQEGNAIEMLPVNGGDNS
ncbi:tumor necrosis factor receptor superfamily member 16-like isoform X1 [Mya arenaria]|uniref:tumor necrosis factor receptor superfamily member 16-like isoform X1 n=2 Tax=Mya arenaria TaxID=6604 RepID=UPI0022E14892|nr:tumor necrosis factor receptor superfamily member 16-like isoform X1 [Mya arenaria]XP_052800990.1 tumor necrosis factor receptor superfamily member 16-like isoform X1 [Mya arenaria]XP_052800991.1 tumor necrosis factor receptor superfamily member 16-like isoform X1 [Mya arenaria]